jgi:PKHD-type hydroxylase
MYSMIQEQSPNEPYAWATNIFSPEEIDLILDLGKSLPQEEGGVNNTGVAKLETRRSKISWICPALNTEFIFHRISTAIQKINRDFYNFELTTMEDIQFSEYDASYQGMYRNHTDDGFEEFRRKISFSLQLSDPEDYDGGDLLIYRFKLDNPFEVKREKGLLSIFPSWTIHEVTPVTRGTRYTLVGWCHGPQFR